MSEYNAFQSILK